MSQVTIAHLTDLHCDRSKGWDERFEQIKACLVKAKPSAIVITGDLCESPSRKSFTHLSDHLGKLVRAIQQDGDEATKDLHRFVMVIPGNHDLAFRGNRAWIVGKWSTPWREFAAHALKDLHASVEDQAIEFFKRYGVALYPFDSNEFSGRSVAISARGKVSKPDERFEDLERRFEKCAPTGAGLCRPKTRIALLHHHPLPLPASSGQELKEPFTILDNANQFLRLAANHGIHLILHGHRHTSGVCRFVLPQRSAHQIVVSSCSSSCKKSESHWELCLLELSDAGTVVRKRYTATREIPEFQLLPEPLHQQQIVEYACRREEHSENHALYTNKWIRRVRSKTKIIRILEDGEALIAVRYQGIEWMPDVRIHEVALREFIRTGIGRVKEMGTAWLSDAGGAASPQIAVPPPQSPGDYVEIEGKACYGPEMPDGCEFSYVVQNAYSLTRQDHEEAYGKQQGYDEQRDWATVESIYPTEYLELIVQYPEHPERPERPKRKYFPDCTRVALDCWRSCDGPVETEQIRLRQYPHDSEEEQFIAEKDAVRFREEVLQISALVRHPQPGRSYTLRWPLLEIASPDQDALSQWNRCRTQFLRQAGPASEARLQELEQELRKLVGDPEMRMAAYAYDIPAPESGKVPRMRAVYPRALLERNIAAPPGRGVYGKAFRSRAPFHFFRSMDRFNPTEPIDGFPPEVDEILALPLLHPVDSVASDGVDVSILRHSKVSAVLVLYRMRVTNDEKKLFPADAREERQFVTQLYQPIIAHFS